MAVLEIIDHTLGVAICALIAEFPALIGDPHPWQKDPPDQLAARRLLQSILRFEQILARYRASTHTRLLSPSPSDRNDIDF
jgi:hypothetical protein